MHDDLPVISIARHGETPWTISAQHTGLTDLLLTAQGETNARGLRRHFIRVLALRWIGLEPPVHCNSFLLSTASLSAVGYDQDVSRPVICLWNDTHHVRK